MKPIFLIGYMGCGKSTLGRALGRMTPLRFIDLDNYIETRYHCTVREIFALDGESRFRDLERRMLDEVSEFEDVVVACGGGTPCFGDNMDMMNSRGTTVFLDTSFPKLLERLKRGRHKRPLIADKSDEELASFIVSALDERIPYYSKAAIRFQGDLLENETEIDDTAMRFITLFDLPTNQ